MRRLAAVLASLILAGCTVEDDGSTAPAPAQPATTAAPAVKAPGEPVISRGSAPPLIASKTSRNESAAPLLDQGKKAEESGDPSAASDYFDRALAVEPTNREALYRSARVNQEMASKFPRPHNSKYLLKSSGAMRLLRKTYPDLNADEKQLLGVTLYNEACTLVQNGDPGRAVTVLGEAYDAGFHDLGQIDQDDELDPVRRSPEFRKLVERMERENVAKLLAQTKTFPFAFSLPDVDGKTVSLADFKGKVTVVDFWGTWCPPCRKEIPHLVALQKKYRDQGLAVVGLNYEQADATADAVRNGIKKFARENGVDYPCVIGDPKTQESVPEFEGFPTTLFVDRSGKVRVKLTGYHSLATLDAVVSALLTEGSAKPEGAAKPKP